ncbi:Uncharacterised protein [Amycolatopsis camponoti]|uniref:Uncharacterized protein n=2 Tax=Amycolatopsis camponoti TaxID=2606593 RepID=A0A6I8M0B7_9PSEU|nr:Uncharacterised protein [Amycolatopsis camponoti]
MRVVNYRFGDKVLFRGDDSEGWVPARVVRAEHVDSRSEYRYSYVKVATSSFPADGYVEGVRVVPAGTPIYHVACAEDVHLVRRDPRWNPFVVEPFMTPDEYQVMGGAAQFQMSGMPGLTHVGAYQSATSYDLGDPVWVWERGWRKAEVLEAKSSWVQARYLEGFRRPNGWPSKSYRPAEVWPVICDFPAPVRKLAIEAEWLQKLDSRRAHLVSLQLGYSNSARYLKECEDLGGCGHPGHSGMAG